MAATTNQSRAIVRSGLVRPGLRSMELPTVELDPRTGFDFLTAVCSDCGELEDLLPEDRRWRELARAASQQDISLSTRNCAGFAQELGRVLINHPEIRTARQVVEAVDAMADKSMLEAMLGDLFDDAELSPLAHRVVEGDKDAYAELGSKLESMKGEAILRTPLDEIPETVRQSLHTWLPRYEEIEARVAHMLEKDVAARRREDVTADPIGFIERTTNGIRLGLDRRVRHIILAPSYFGRPYNSLTKLGDIQVVIYPIADSSLGSASRTTPPVATVRLYRALGDESRLRILRLLAERDRYLTELANELDLRKPTISHHLAQLRSAGLVTVTEQGNLTYYSLRRDRIREAGPELASFLAQ